MSHAPYCTSLFSALHISNLLNLTSTFEIKKHWLTICKIGVGNIYKSVADEGTETTALSHPF